MWQTRSTRRCPRASKFVYTVKAFWYYKAVRSMHFDAQELQDSIFRKMTADERVAFGSRLWLIAYSLAKNKITHDTRRPASATRKSR